MAKRDATGPNDSHATLRYNKLETENDASVEAVLALIQSDGWTEVKRKPGVTVSRKFMQPPSPPVPSSATNDDGDDGENVAQVSSGEGGFSSCCGGQKNVDEKAAAKFACVKVEGTINATADDVYKLFQDNERVHEYNENCVELRDLEWLSPDTKVSWSATRNIGPLKARDFVTIVHYRNLEDGAKIVVNRPAEHPDARRGNKYVRAQVLRAANIVRPNPRDPTKTDFTNVMHVNPGGVGNSWMGAQAINRLCGMAADIVRSLEVAANRSTPNNSVLIE